MLKSKWNSLLKVNSYVLYALAILPDSVLWANHVKPFSTYEKRILNTYYSRGQSVPYSYIKLFKNNNKALDMASAYYKNIDRNHNLVKNFRKFLLLDFTTKFTDKRVHLYTLEITAKPYGYHVQRASNGKLWIIDASGQKSYPNWTSTLHNFKSNKLKRSNASVLGSMPHCKPNLQSLLELHSHINLFSQGKTTLTQSSIASYFSDQLGFPVSARLRPMKNALTDEPIVFDNSNYDEPVHLITQHDSHMADTDDSNDDSQNAPGNDYDSVEDEEDKSGQLSDPMSVPDAPDNAYQDDSQAGHHDGKSLSNVDVLTGLGLRGIAEYALATINSSYGITRRFTFSYKQTSLYRNYKRAIKQYAGQLATANVITSQPAVDDSFDRKRAIMAITRHRNRKAVHAIRTYLSAIMKIQPASVINEAWTDSLHYPSACYEDGLQLDYPVIMTQHEELVGLIQMKLGEDYFRFIAACINVIMAYIAVNRECSMKSAREVRTEPYIHNIGNKKDTEKVSAKQDTYLNSKTATVTAPPWFEKLTSGIPP